MSDVISVFKGSTLYEGKPGNGKNCRSEAVNNLLSILPNIDERELKFTINDEYFQAKADQSEELEKETTSAITDTFGSTMRKSLRKMIREIDLYEIIHGATEYLSDEKASRRQSEAFASKIRKSSTPFTDTSLISRRGIKVRSSLDYNVKRKYSTSSQAIAEPSIERRDSCFQVPRTSEGRRMSTRVEGNNLKKERLQRESISNRSIRTNSLVPRKICNIVDNSVGFALSPPSRGCAINPSLMKNGTWQKKEHTRRKVTSWLAQQLEQIVV